jgi:hypothetical protein
LGKSGYLPDISSNFGFWREYSVNALRENNYQSAQAGLYNLNQCLTDDYLVRISTKEYEEEERDKTVFQCSHCTMEQKEIINKGEEDEKIKITTVPTEILHSGIDIFEKPSSLIERAILGLSTSPLIKKRRVSIPFPDTSNFGFGVSNPRKNSMSRKYWICPECNEENFQTNNQWNIVKTIREKPYSLGVVPEPPLEPPQLAHALGYPSKFKIWFFRFLEEIQTSMVRYRIEFVSQNGREMDDSGYRDKGDSNGHN